MEREADATLAGLAGARPASAGGSGLFRPLEAPAEAARGNAGRGEAVAEADRGEAGEGSPLVSVIIPCYRQGRFLPRALASVLAQTYSRLEVLVVDDGSPEPVEAVVKRFPGVRCVRQGNAGLAGARNRGLRATRGEFVVFLDADDRLLPEAVAAGLAAFREAPESGMVAGGHYLISPAGKRSRLKAPRLEREEVYSKLLESNFIGMHAAVMYRRAVLERLGGFNPALRACEDYDVYLRLARLHRVRLHAAPVAEYHLHGANMSSDPSLMLRMSLRVLGTQKKWVGKNPLYLESFHEGRRFWKRFYGDQMLRCVKRQWVEERAWRKGAATAVLLAWHAPGKLFGEGLRAGVRAGLRRWAPIWLLKWREALRGRVYAPPKHRVRFGDLRRLSPIRRDFGFSRGLPIDRHYIEQFLERHAGDVRGRVLEIGDSAYSRRFGGERVERFDVLHAAEGNPAATFVGDLAAADHLPSSAFDCVLLTQTLQLIYDARAALRTVYRILKPGGVLLATAPGITPIDAGEWRETWYWSFTERSIRRMCGEAFPPETLCCETHGNVLAATAFLQGITAEELTREELGDSDPQYPVILAFRAVKEKGTG